jgi:predicted dehydrogenase
VVALGEKARAKKLSLAVGFQIRHASPYVELAKRVHAGEIGTPVSARSTTSLRRSSGPSGPTRRPRRVAAQLGPRHRTLGDIIVEQNIHIIDVTNWLLKANPVKAVGSASRAGRTDQGDCSSHYNCVFTYPGNVAVSFASTQFTSAKWGGVGMQYYGTKGWAEARYDAPVRISAESEWEFPGLKKPEPTTRPRP